MESDNILRSITLGEPEYRVIDDAELRLVIWAATSDANESDQD